MAFALGAISGVRTLRMPSRAVRSSDGSNPELKGTVRFSCINAALEAEYDTDAAFWRMSVGIP
jgi:hypothetical protein